MATTEEIRLLFFGTFFHENTELTADLVQLKQPVRITEIRVIPLGATVDLSTGSFQLGATNPSEFDIEFYYNDLQMPSKSSFELLRIFDFNDKARIKLVCDPAETIITDGLLVRGMYSTVTLAVYGFPVDSVPIKEVEEVKKEISPPSEKVIIPKDKENSPPPDAEVIDSPDAKVEVPVDIESDVSGIGDAEVKTLDTSMLSGHDIPESETESIPPNAEDMMKSLPLQERKNEENDDESTDDVTQMVIDDQNEEVLSQGSVVNTSVNTTTDESPHKVAPVVLDEVMDTEEISDGEVFPSDDEEEEAPNKVLEEKDNEPSSAPDEEEKMDQQQDTNEAFIIDPLIEEAESISSPPQEPGSEENDDSLLDEFRGPGFEEIISDEEIDFPDYDYGEWEDWAGKFTHPFNPFSDPIEVLPLKNVLPEFVTSTKKTPEDCKMILIQKCRKWRPDQLKSYVPESWVEDMEKLLPLVPAALFSLSNDPSIDVLSSLLCWIRVGVDFNVAVKQPSLPFKTRHLKVGLKLLQCLSLAELPISRSVLEVEFVDSSGNPVPLQQHLFNLMKPQAMSKTFKVLVIKTLDAVTSSALGYKHFVTGSPSCLQRLLEYSLDPSFTTRMSFSLRCLLNKLRLMDDFQKLTRLVETLPIEQGEYLTRDVDEDFKVLKDLAETAQNVNQHFAHPLRFLPAKTVIELPDSSSAYGPRRSFIRTLAEMKFLPVAATLLSLKESEILGSAVSHIVNILMTLLSWEEGLYWLCNEGQITSTIIKCLLQGDDSRVNAGLLMAHCMELMQLVDILSAKPSSTGNEELFKLQTAVTFLGTAIGRESVVKIFCQGNFVFVLLKCIHPMQPGLSESEKIVRKGYAMQILDFVVRHSESVELLEKHGTSIFNITTNEHDRDHGLANLQYIQSFLKPSLDPVSFNLEGVEILCESIKAKRNDLLQSRTLACNWGYPGEMTTCFRILRDMGMKFLVYLKTSDISMESRLDLAVGTEDNDLSRNLLSETDELRIRELKYDLAIAKIHYLDMVPTMVSILQKIAEEFVQPAMHTHVFVSAKGDALLSLVSPMVKIFRKCISQVVHARKAEFKDTTSVQILLKLYRILYCFPPSALNYAKAKDIASDIVGILLAYTIPAMKLGSENEEELNKSTWTATVGEIIKFMMDEPANFKPGLNLLSEVLPLPFPIAAKKDLSTDTCNEAVRLRRLWSAYVHSLSGQLQEMIGILCVSSNPTVSNLLKRVCYQLADMSASTCLSVSRGILDVYLLSLEIENDSPASEANTTSQAATLNAWVDTAKTLGDKQSSEHSTRILAFLASLMSNCPAVKCGVLQVLKATTKIDEKYCDVLNVWSCILTMSKNVKLTLTSSHIQAQDHIVTIFQSLCDLEISPLVPMFGRGSKTFPSDFIITNSIPSKDFLSIIVSSLCGYLISLESTSPNLQIIDGVLRTLEMIAETDYGFSVLTGLIDKKPGIMERCGQAILRGITESNCETFESGFPCVMAFLDCVKSLATARPLPMGSFPPRLSSLSKEQLKSLFCLKDKQTEEPEPGTGRALFDLREIVQKKFDIAKEDSSVFNGLEPLDLLPSLQMIEQILEKITSSAADDASSLVDMKLPAPETLVELFNVRPIYVILDTSDCVESLPVFWLTSVPPAFELDEEHEEMELVPCDLEELAKTHLGSFDIAKEIEAMTKIQSADTKIDIKTDNDDRNINGQGRAGHMGLGFLSRRGQFGGLRGAGRGMFSRGMAGMGRGYDPFRSRPPNTSRPPSLHVDDFVAMASGQPSTRPASTTDPYSPRGRGGMLRGASGDPYSHDRRRTLLARPPGSGMNYYQGGSRHDSMSPSARLLRGGRIYSTPNSDRWTADSRMSAPPSPYDRTNRPAQYDDKYRSSPGGSSVRNPSSSLPRSQQYSSQRPGMSYQDGSRNSPNEGSYHGRWKERSGSSSKPFNR